MMLNIRIENFLKTRKIGFVEAGLSRERIIELLGEPDDVLDGISVYYKYGCLQIGFDYYGRLNSIGVKFPYRGRKSAEINGVLKIENFMSIKRMNIGAFERFLSRQGIDYHVDESRCNETYLCIVLFNKVEVFFDKEPEKPNTISTLFHFQDTMFHNN